MQETIINWLAGMPKEWAVFLMSMLPVTELRASIPVAILKYHLSPESAYFWSILGNTLLGAITIVLVNPITDLVISKVGWLDRIWEKYIGKLHRKHQKKFAKWEAWALVSFVAIPLPMTGAFSGAVASSIFKIRPKKAIPLIFLGCLIAGLIVTFITLAFKL